MRNWLGAALCTAVLGAALPAWGQAGEGRILAAREAARSGDRLRLDALAAQRSSHVLEPYVQYWQLSNRLLRDEPAPEAALHAFISAEPSSYLAERLRADWLRRLAKEGDWEAFLALYPALQAPDAELQCRALYARLLRGDGGAIEPARALLLSQLGAEEGCATLFATLAGNAYVDAGQLWWRVRRQVEAKKSAEAEQTLAWLAVGEQPDRREWRQALNDPRGFLALLPANFAVERSRRELALLAVAQLAREDVAGAAQEFGRIEQRLSGPERAYAYTQLGWRGALEHDLRAPGWFRAAGDSPMTDEQRAWRVRSALRVSDWAAVRAFVEAMPASQLAEPAWTYWLGRALLQAGEVDEARFRFMSIADGASFYNILAAEELGRRFEPPPSRPASREARLRAESDAGLRRALALLELDWRTEGVREWNWTLRGKDDDFLIAAAELAERHQVYDRAINTADLARNTPSFQLAYLAPYRELIEPQARRQGLDMGWVYGLMRQESRFVPAARSVSGAQGLMQVMPATGKWVAGKIGLKGYTAQSLAEPNTNVLLGTSYMRMVLEGLDNHPVLASAGYNAGPSRAKRWKDGRTLEGAVYTETIPIDETRDYVRKVMGNTVVYAALFENRAQSLKERLGWVAARSE